MFDVGFSELLLIGVLALVIAGPERLPGIMRTLGRFAGRARATVAAVRSELEREIDLEESARRRHEQQERERKRGQDDGRDG